jgi:2-polyprenyl-3-methyl-5-hydroxy-6-metoxy-1,4-benzoquinol methylase
MSSATHASPSPHRKIEYLSRPAEVSMSDGYFQLASLDHFWVRRRFEVFQKLTGDSVNEARNIAEVGCGHGILQRQVEDSYGREVRGFDLNEYGLKHNLSQFSGVYCYDIYQCEETFRKAFDLIFLWDVLEHIPDEDSFLQAILFHLAPGGKMIVNVPAGKWAFSNYDRAAGHVRRYSAASFQSVAKRNRLQVTNWTYWGLPLIPTLFVRKFLLTGQTDPAKAYAAGFDANSKIFNSIMAAVSRCEFIPQTLFGTSILAVLVGS